MKPRNEASVLPYGAEPVWGTAGVFWFLAASAGAGWSSWRLAATGDVLEYGPPLCLFIGVALIFTTAMCPRSPHVSLLRRAGTVAMILYMFMQVLPG